MNLPHSTFSRTQLDSLLWLLQTNDVSKVPTKCRVKKSAKELHTKHGIRKFSYDGALGNKYYANSISDIIAQVTFFTPSLRMLPILYIGDGKPQSPSSPSVLP